MQVHPIVGVNRLVKVKGHAYCSMHLHIFYGHALCIRYEGLIGAFLACREAQHGGSQGKIVRDMHIPGIA